MYGFYVGLDLGQRSDYTAVSIIETPVWIDYDAPVWTIKSSTPQAGLVMPSDMAPIEQIRAQFGSLPSSMRPKLSLRYLQRFELNTPYPVIVDSIVELMAKPPLCGRAALLVDATGVGRPVVDMLDRAGLSPLAITITGGDTVTIDGREYRVPKRDLAMCVQVLLQDRRLEFAGALPLLDVLTKELQQFEVKIDKRTAHDSYLAWREGAHDDLVLSVAVAAWYAEYCIKNAPSVEEEYDPFHGYRG